MPRQKSFDPDAALERAMELFWQRGYEGTSTSALLKHMGISRQSLYDTFGDKEQLFQQALDRYARHNVTALLGALERPEAAAADVRAYFERLPDILVQFPERRACLLVNTMTDRIGDPASAAAVSAHRARLEAAFRGALFNATRSGLRLPLPPAPLAASLAASVVGITVASRAGASEAELRQLVASALTLAGL